MPQSCEAAELIVPQVWEGALSQFVGLELQPLDDGGHIMKGQGGRLSCGVIIDGADITQA